MVRTWKPAPKQQSVLSCVGLDWEKDPQEWQWKYGYHLAPLANQPEPSPDGRYYMTSRRMIDHVGLLEDVYNDPTAMDFYNTHPNEWALRQRMAAYEFDHKILVPIRKNLERAPYESTFYRIPALKLEIHPKTGTVVFTSVGESVLKLIPLSTSVGILRGIKRANLTLIAPDAIYVILKKKQAYRTIKDEEHLLHYLDGWMSHIRDGKMRQAIFTTFKGKSPTLVGERVTQLMLAM